MQTLQNKQKIPGAFHLLIALCFMLCSISTVALAEDDVPQDR